MSAINSETKLLGLIGNPVKHSLSPEMHNAAIRTLGLNMAYISFAVESTCLTAALDGMAALGFIGFNVTIPYKEAVLPFLDSIHSDANIIGAVNTVIIKRGKLFGYNTDGIGFVRSLEEHDIDPADKNILLLGAGGAAKAVAVALALKGTRHIVIANRSLNRATDLSEKIIALGASSKAIPLHGLNEPNNLQDIDLLVNTTPVGMNAKAEFPLIAAGALPDDCVVYDLVYGPRKSKLLEEAASRGLNAFDGSGMLLHQGAEAFSLFTGLVPPINAMREALDVALCSKM
jgi:shikimate dehydrogenase